MPECSIIWLSLCRRLAQCRVGVQFERPCFERRADWKTRATETELVSPSFAHAPNSCRCGRGNGDRRRLLAECRALFLLAHLACFPGFARLLGARQRPEKSRVDGGAVLQAREVSRPDPRSLSLLGDSRRRERSRRSSLCGVARLCNSPALRSLQLQPSATAARHRSARSLSFLSHS